MADTIHSCSPYCDRHECIKRQRDELRENIGELTAERDAWRRLVIEHNAMLDCCHRLKDDPCEGCPKQYSIAIPPELEQSS